MLEEDVFVQTNGLPDRQRRLTLGSVFWLTPLITDRIMTRFVPAGHFILLVSPLTSSVRLAFRSASVMPGPSAALLGLLGLVQGLVDRQTDFVVFRRQRDVGPNPQPPGLPLQRRAPRRGRMAMAGTLILLRLIRMQNVHARTVVRIQADKHQVGRGLGEGLGRVLEPWTSATSLPLRQARSIVRSVASGQARTTLATVGLLLQVGVSFLSGSPYIRKGLGVHTLHEAGTTTPHPQVRGKSTHHHYSHYTLRNIPCESFLCKLFRSTRLVARTVPFPATFRQSAGIIQSRALTQD